MAKREVVVAWVVVLLVMLLKMLAPVKVLLSARRVEEAALMVISPVPSKETPLMRRAVCNAVAVEALPVKLPKIPPEAVKTPVIVEEAEMVEEAVARKPCKKPRVVEVETP